MVARPDLFIAFPSESHTNVGQLCILVNHYQITGQGMFPPCSNSQTGPT